MNSLEDFEKQLAKEKADGGRSEGEKEERKHRRQRHGDRSRSPRDRDERHNYKDGDRHHRHRYRGDDDDGHRHKRSRHSGDDEDRSDKNKHGKSEMVDQADPDSTDPKGKLPLPDEEATQLEHKTVDSKRLTRDAWMTAPSGMDVDYVHRPDQARKSAPPKEEPRHLIHRLELNASHLEDLNSGKNGGDPNALGEKEVDYKFGDQGSQWRMTKLKAVYTLAEQTGRSVDEVAIERFGSLREFDDAREEKIELDRRNVYGDDYVGKEQPTGELYRQRKLKDDKSRSASPEPEQGAVVQGDTHVAGQALSQTDLNRLRAEFMKAKLRRVPDAAKLEAAYNQAMVDFAKQDTQPIILDAMTNRMLASSRGEVKQVETKRGRERGKVEQNEDMSVEDMVREERRTRGQAGGDSMRLAERIAKDSRFDNDLEYMDENAEKLAKRVHKSELDLRNVAINEFQKVNRILENCPLCHHEDTNRPPIAPVVSLGTRVYLTLPTEPEVSEGGAVIVPLSHRKNLLECDDDEWEEIRNFMKSLTRMYHDQGREVIFYENAAAPHRHLHAAMMAVAIPYEDGAMTPAYFKEAFLSTDEEWSQHKKIIDTEAKARDGQGRMAFRRSIAKEMPYFHVWFSLDGGLGHVVENSDMWPKGDLFAREIVGGILDVAPDVIKKQGRWRKGDDRVDGFKKRWKKFDWTRVLTNG
jgi:Protein similar to CwfJ C-terminus 2/Protein similar to CwfJ C-terminus 1